MKEEKSTQKISRRKALKYIGFGALGAIGLCNIANKKVFANFIDNAQNGDVTPVSTRKGKLRDNKVSLLGFGCMRFPQKGDGTIDVEQTEKMIDYAYKHGVNYFDTAYPYLGGKSETIIGNALKNYPRASFNLADKMPTWLISNLKKGTDIFEEQLQKCGVDYFDYYLLHSLSSQSSYENAYEKTGLYNYLVEQKKKGRIKHLGFSFHGSVDFFKYLLDKHNWDFVQIQLNYMDWDDERQQSGTLYNMLEERGIQCVIMEPVKGGMLATLNADAEKILKTAEPDKSIASWAIRYAASLPNVLTVLSGMSNMQHVVDNINSVTNFKPLTTDEQATLQLALAAYLKYKQIPCTACAYCMPCPFGVNIPGVFKVYNNAVKSRNIPNLEAPRNREFERKKKTFLEAYNTLPEKKQAHNCRECMKCTKICPQALPIPQHMKMISKLVEDLKK